MSIFLTLGSQCKIVIIFLANAIIENIVTYFVSWVNKRCGKRKRVEVFYHKLFLHIWVVHIHLNISLLIVNVGKISFALYL